MRLKGKIAVITGGASGMGKATVERFVAEGATVVVADISGQETAVAAELGERAVAYNIDVRSPEAVEKMFAFVDERFGRLDILFNNAGLDGEFVPTVDNSVENFTRVLEVNARGVLLGTKYGAPLMIRGGGGSIINTSSTTALRALPNMAVYGGSKAAIIGITRTTAIELAPHNIRVNAICPGPIVTPMLRGLVGDEGLVQMKAIVPMNRLGRPDEIAGVALFLATEDASFVNGAIIPVDGGQTC